jgi:hypothetical protein
MWLAKFSQFEEYLAKEGKILICKILKSNSRYESHKSSQEYQTQAHAEVCKCIHVYLYVRNSVMYHIYYNNSVFLLLLFYACVYCLLMGLWDKIIGLIWVHSSKKSRNTGISVLFFCCASSKLGDLVVVTTCVLEVCGLSLPGHQLCWQVCRL